MRITRVSSRPLVLFSVSLCLQLLIPSLAVAQIDQKEKAEKELERKQELERRTLALLDEIATGAWGLKLPENRSFVLANVADLLWERDEKRARNMYWEALNSLNLNAGPPAAAPTGKQSNDKIETQYWMTFTSRREFLRRVARRDPQLALDMLRASRQPPPDLTNVKYRLPDESDLEQEIASEAAARDPQRALQIARESLGRGLRLELLNMLMKLNERDADLASEFAGDIIGKLRTENFETNIDASIIAIELLEYSRTPRNAPAGDLQPTAFRVKRLKLNDEQKRDLVELITISALSVSAKGNLVTSVAEVMPEIEQFAPGRVAALQRRLGEQNRLLTREEKEWNTYNSLFRNGSAEDMIRAAATASDATRDTFYREAVLAAVARGRADSLREFINDQVADKSRRNSLIDSLDAEQIGRAVYAGKTEELQKLLSKVRLKEQRARLLAEIAITLEKKGQHVEALELLDEAQSLIKTDFRSETQMDAVLTLVLAYALVNPAKAFAIIEPIIDRANDEISKLMLLDKVMKNGFVKKNEIILSMPGIPMDFALFKYGKGVSAMANADFNRTKAAADRFQRPELRVMARLLLAQALLHNQEESGKNSEQ